MKEKVKLTVGDIIITWCLKLFCDAVFFVFCFFFFQKMHKLQHIRKHVQQNLWGQHLKNFKEMKQNISRALLTDSFVTSRSHRIHQLDTFNCIGFDWSGRWRPLRISCLELFWHSVILTVQRNQE